MAADEAQIIDFLKKNFESRPEHKQSWQELILGDEDMKNYLTTALLKLEMKSTNGENYVPEDGRILKSLTYVAPSDVKAILVAHDPEIHREMATGLAFSFPEGYKGRPLTAFLQSLGVDNIRNLSFGDLRDEIESRGNKPKGFAMVMMKIALVRAEVEGAGNFENFCYEYWAEKGILLLNSCLTVTEGVSQWEQKHTFWHDFTARLIYKVISQEGLNRRVSGMFWGDFARKVFNKVKEHNGESNANLSDCKHYHHPTFPIQGDNNYLENAVSDFQRLHDLLVQP